MFGPRIRISRPLFEKAADLAKARGYASVDEFVAHLLEQEITTQQEADTDQHEVEERLRGLGYI